MVAMNVSLREDLSTVWNELLTSQGDVNHSERI